jgi:hypothetical protein
LTHPVKGIDHVFLLIDDLDEGLERYRALGFTVSPRGMHSAVKGTANHTIMFPDDYVELLGILQPTPANAARRDLLARSGEGLHAIACRIAEAEAAAADLAELGIGTRDLGSFERPVDLPDGTTGAAAFTTVAFEPSETPFGFVFMCQHRSRETVWIPELIGHANGAIGLGGIVASSTDVARDAAGFFRLFADGRVTRVSGGAQIHTGPNSAPILLYEPDALAALYPGIDVSQTAGDAFAALRIRVSDIKLAKAACVAAGATMIETATGIAIPPEQACGAILEFIQA